MYLCVCKYKGMFRYTHIQTLLLHSARVHIHAPMHSIHTCAPQVPYFHLYMCSMCVCISLCADSSVRRILWQTCHQFFLDTRTYYCPSSFVCMCEHTECSIHLCVRVCVCSYKILVQTRSYKHVCITDEECKLGHAATCIPGMCR